MIWDKQSVGLGDVRFPWGSGYELIFVSGDGWTGRRSVPVLRYPMARAEMSAMHPSLKPLGLMSELISKAPPGVVADPFAGSGATLIAARNLGRKVIAVELEERYCEIAARRLAQDVLDFGGAAL